MRFNVAYTFFPKSTQEIDSELKDFPEENLKEIKRLFAILKPKAPTPINIDPGKKSNVNVTRQVQDDMTIADIKSKAGQKKIK